MKLSRARGEAKRKGKSFNGDGATEEDAYLTKHEDMDEAYFRKIVFYVMLVSVVGGLFVVINISEKFL